MSSKNYLYRGGEKISVEKEPDFFTLILPNPQLREAVRDITPVETLQLVFDDVYKIKTRSGERDEVMDYLRQNERFAGICHHAYHPTGDDATRYYITDMLTLCFHEDTPYPKIEAILEKHGLKFIKTYGEETDRTYLLQVTQSAGKNPVKVCEDLQEYAEVVFAEPNLINRFQSYYTPQDNLFRHQWHLKSTKGIELTPEAHIDASGAWDITRGSRAIVVAVIDDGFDLAHPDLNGAGKIVFPRDFVDADKLPLPDRKRGDYHGTPCAGLAIGEENGSGIVGVAPGCSFMPVRFGMTGDDNLLYEIFDYTGKKADVISCSWGPVPVFAPISSLLQKQLATLSKTGGPNGRGCTILFAAGNYNAPIRDMDNTSFTWRHPTAGLKQTKGAILNGHAAHPNVITVAASTSQNRKAIYSNWGKEIDCCAPSDNVHPIDIQQRVPGQSLWTTDNEKLGNRYTDKFGGTSGAAPQVAGVAALILSINPALTAEQVRDILVKTADKIVDNHPEPVFQLKKGTYDQNGHSEWFGYGKINAFRAVKLALDSKDTTKPPPDQPMITEGIHISAAMVNPKGSDKGSEMIALLNATDQTQDLSGWEVRNKRGESERIPALFINPGNTGVIVLKQIRLPNLGGEIRLFNPDGIQVDKVSYGLLEGIKEGWWIKF